MSTKEDYFQLWEIFENLLKEKKLELEDFARIWEKEHPEVDNAEYRVFIKKIKTQQDRKNQNKFQRINANTLVQIQEYIDFIKTDTFSLEFKNINFDTWFD